VLRNGSAVSLLYIDADHFKALNDSQGHHSGDECLVSLAAEFRRVCKRKTDLAARYGGEEFTIILPDTGATAAEQFAQSVRLAIAALNLPHPASPTAPFLTVSIGVATATRQQWSTPDTLLAAADQALYEAKNAGRNRVLVALTEVVPSSPPSIS
jgi:diguanylate cyclase (GGDEF)-like protein